MWFAYLYRRGATASDWIPDPDEVAAAPTEAECVTGLLEPPWDATYELGVDPLPEQIPDIRPQLLVPVPRMFARVDTADWTGQTYEYVGVQEDPTAPAPLPPNPLPREPLEEHSVHAVHLLPPVGTSGQLLALDTNQELSWLSPGTIALEDGSVTTAKLAPNAVTADKIVDGSITGTELAAGTITAEKLAVGVIPPPPGAASDATPGLIAIETTAEVLAGTDQTKALTIGRLLVRTATPTRLGLTRTATPAAVVEGLNDTDAATPAGVKAAIAAIPVVPEASEATPGILRIAPQPTVNAGLDDTQAVSSLKLATRLAAIPVASTSQPSLVQLSQIPETVTGINNTHATTPEGVHAAIAAIPVASTSQPSLLQLAPPAETVTGTNDTHATHPAGVKAALEAALQTKVPPGTPLSVTRYAASGQALEEAPGVLTTANAGQLVLGSNTAGLGAANLLVVERQGATQSTWTAGGVSGTTNGVGIVYRTARNTLSTPQSVQSGDTLGFLAFSGHNGSAYSGHQTRLEGFAEEAWSPTTLGSSLRIQTTLVGQSTRAERLRITGDGHLTTWSGGKTGLGTPLTATLGSGASYPTLSVNGSTLYVGASSVQERPMGGVDSTWATATDASRKARMTLSVYDHLAAREGLRLEADGAACLLSFFGQPAVARPSVPAAATDAGTTQTLANALRTALVTLGLCV